MKIELYVNRLAERPNLQVVVAERKGMLALVLTILMLLKQGGEDGVSVALLTTDNKIEVPANDQAYTIDTRGRSAEEVLNSIYVKASIKQKCPAGLMDELLETVGRECK